MSTGCSWLLIRSSNLWHLTHLYSRDLLMPATPRFGTCSSFEISSSRIRLQSFTILALVMEVSLRFSFLWIFFLVFNLFEAWKCWFSNFCIFDSNLPIRFCILSAKLLVLLDLDLLLFKLALIRFEFCLIVECSLLNLISTNSNLNQSEAYDKIGDLEFHQQWKKEQSFLNPSKTT